MSLGALVSALADHLTATLVPAPALVGGAVPAAREELPAVTISIGEANERVGGIGGIGAVPAAAATAEVTVDLARPAPALLSKDRRTLGLPLGPPVDALTVALGDKALAVAAKAPGKGEVQPNADRRELKFGSALPASGTLRLRYPPSASSGRRAGKVHCSSTCAPRTPPGSKRSAGRSHPRSGRR